MSLDIKFARQVWECLLISQGLPFCQAWSGSKLFDKVISRWHSVGNELSKYHFMNWVEVTDFLASSFGSQKTNFWETSTKSSTVQKLWSPGPCDHLDCTTHKNTFSHLLNESVLLTTKSILSCIYSVNAFRNSNQWRPWPDCSFKEQSDLCLQCLPRP